MTPATQFTPVTILLISLFGVLGVLARFFINEIFSRLLTPTAFPISTFTINLIGSFLIGALYVASVEKGLLSNEFRLGMMLGLLGGFTTFSAFSLESLVLFESGRHILAIIYFLASPIFGFACAFAGATACRMTLGG
jgi:CrcB protein